MTTKIGFQCIAIHDQSRAAGYFTANAIYPLSERIEDNYQTVIADNGRGFALTPGNGRWVNAGEPFIEFRQVEIAVEDEPLVTAPDYIPEEELTNE